MSSFHQFKILFALLFALYFQGCDWFKTNTNSNSNSTVPSNNDGSEPANKLLELKTEEGPVSEKIKKLKTLIDVEVAKISANLTSSDSVEGELLLTESEELKNSLDIAASSDNIDQETLNELQANVSMHVDLLNELVSTTSSESTALSALERGRNVPAQARTPKKADPKLSKPSSKDGTLENSADRQKRIDDFLSRPEKAKVIIRRSFLSEIGVDAKNTSDHAELGEFVIKIVSKAVDQYVATGKPKVIKSARDAIAKSMLDTLVSALVEQHLAPSSDATAIALKKNEIMQEVKDAKTKNQILALVLAKYLKPKEAGSTSLVIL